MPVVEVEIREDGTFPSLPEPIQQFINRKIDESYKRGSDKKAEALSPYLADPNEMERLKGRDRLLAEIEAKEAERQKEYDKAAKTREEIFLKDKADAVKAEQAKTTEAVNKLKASHTAGIKAVAKALGARDESLDDLERLLGVFVDLDEQWNPVVKDDQGNRRLDAEGKPLTVEGLVSEHLAKHKYYVKADPVQGGQSRGGATFSGARIATDDKSRIVADLTADPTLANLARGMAAIGKRAS